MGPSVLAIDGPSAWFRAFYGVPSTVVAPDGSPVNAVRGFIDVLARQISEHRPDHLVVAEDADWRPAWRVALVPAYKAHRVDGDPTAPGAGLGDGTPAELSPQVELIREVMTAAGICYFGVPGYEADDILGTLAHQATGPALVLTGDRDLFQLVRDEPMPVRVLYSVERLKPYGPVEVAERFGIPGTAYADYATLRGDASDGLPGVKGIGDKTAAALIARFGSLAGLREALADGSSDGFPAGARAKLLAAEEYLAAAEPVVRVVTDVALPPHDPRVPARPARPDALAALAKVWGLEGAVGRLTAALEGRSG
jgi:5'-3' exonuclease